MEKTESMLVYDKNKENFLFFMVLNQYNHENLYPSDHYLKKGQSQNKEQSKQQKLDYVPDIGICWAGLVLHDYCSELGKIKNRNTDVAKYVHIHFHQGKLSDGKVHLSPDNEARLTPVCLCLLYESLISKLSFMYVFEL